MEAPHEMAVKLMTKRAFAAAEPWLPPATGSNRTLSKAELEDFCRRVVENYARQRQLARLAGVGLAAAVIALAGCGIHRLDNTRIPKDD